jgi:uncharacterized protein (TIGR03382 family)
VSLKKSLLLVVVVSVGSAAAPRTAEAHYERCTIYEGKDTCLAGDTCTQQDGGQGICIPPPCKDNSDCSKKVPLRQCDTRQSYPVCVECFADSECSAPLLCELDPRSFVSNRCSECTVGRIGACANSPRGHICVYDRGSCGCNDHVDCAPTHFCRRNDCIPRPGGAGSKPPSEEEEKDAGSSPNASSVDAGVGSGKGEPGPMGGGSGCSSSSASAMPSLPFAVWLVVTAMRRRRRAKESRAVSSSQSAA